MRKIVSSASFILEPLSQEKEMGSLGRLAAEKPVAHSPFQERQPQRLDMKTLAPFLAEL